MRPVLASVTLTWFLPVVLLLAAVVLARARRVPLAVLLGVLGVAAAALVGRTFSLAGYGTMLALALSLGSALTVWLAAREGFPPVFSATVVVGAQVGALVGARLLHLVVNPADWARPFDLQHGGLVAYGGFLGGAGAAWLLLRGRFAHFADLAAPSLGLGLMLTRVGCWFAGCDFGVRQGATPSWLKALGTFPPLDTPVMRQQRAECVSDCASLASHSSPVHPTELYESAVGLTLFVVALLLLQARRGAAPGRVFLLVASFYGVLRAVLEVWRGDLGRGEWTAPAWLGPALALGLGAALLGVAAWRLEGRARTLSLVLGSLGALGAALGLLDSAAPATLSTSQLAGLGSSALCVALVARRDWTAGARRST
ncbi:MAG: prolipoprotein diacylglyceryl transferase [Myxococcales bacterium]|nr:prolipoprotein diacylglyceryl transferase [Myxococcales bacterium]